tara:strand:+ start:350 stop:961 length:612 start_codon:yes stop_codon:yes gene_type:complete
MPVKIHGKDYKTVAERLNEFHADHKENRSIITEIIQFKDGIVVVKAVVKIGDDVFTGHAYEDIGSNMINEHNALENCETSAIGRSLSTAGWAGSEFASADELVTALNKQNTPSKAKKEDLSGNDWRDKPIGFKSGKNQGKTYREVDEETLVWIINDCKVDAWKQKAVAEMQLRENPDNNKKTEFVSDEPRERVHLEEAEELGF